MNSMCPAVAAWKYHGLRIGVGHAPKFLRELMKELMNQMSIQGGAGFAPRINCQLFSSQRVDTL